MRTGPLRRLTQPTVRLSSGPSRIVAEQQLNRYFEMVEAELNYHQKRSTRPA
jgi:hypothetical protein